MISAFCVSAFSSCATAVSAVLFIPIGDVVIGLAAFALGWLAINFAEAYEHLAVNIRCACGRREMRDVLCSPEDRAALARELSKTCFHCNPSPPSEISDLKSPSRIYLGDHDGD